MNLDSVEERGSFTSLKKHDKPTAFEFLLNPHHI